MSMGDLQVSVQDRGDPELSMILDETTLDPNLHYRFVQERPQSVARKKLLGYSVVSRTSSKVRTLVDLDQRADDTIRYGDAVLMSMPKAKYLERSRRKGRLVQDRIDATAENFREKVERAQAAGVDVRFVDKYEDKGPKLEDE